MADQKAHRAAKEGAYLYLLKKDDGVCAKSRRSNHGIAGGVRWGKGQALAAAGGFIKWGGVQSRWKRPKGTRG